MVIIKTDPPLSVEKIKALLLQDIRVAVDLKDNRTMLFVPATHYIKDRLNCRDGKAVNWRVLKGLGITPRHYCS
jgi:hypothetical protein